jgi:SAM-dependent methyltransferase
MNDLLPHFGSHGQVEHTILEPMIRWLCGGRALRVQDGGCGEGEPALEFAAQGCAVVGVDLDPEALEAAGLLRARTACADRMSLARADLTRLPYSDGAFDLAWSSAVLHHMADRLAAVRELRRVLKPGGRLAIRESGLAPHFLPFDIGLGEPGLQDRLSVADDRWFVAMTRDTLRDERPYPFGWSQLLRDTRFADVQARTFTMDALSPLNPAEGEFVVHHLRRTLDRDAGPYGPLLEEADRRALRELLDPDGARYVLKRSDLHLRYGLSVYVGEKR